MADAALLARLRHRQDAMLALLQELVMTETPSEDLDRIRAGVRHLSTVVSELLGERPEVIDVQGRPHLRLRGTAQRPVLVVCHLDTVWPAGTTRRWPFAVADGRATGPGIFDMKAGLVQGLHAVSELGGRPDVTLLITTDEEIGSPGGRALLEAEARRSRAVLVLEPSADGALKTERKGISLYRLHVEGRAAHAGLEPERGVNALVELAHQVPGLVQLADARLGTTVTPTTATAGTTINTVPATAEMSIDVRAWTVAEQDRVHAALGRIGPVVDGAALRLAGGVNRPPLEAGASAALMALAARCARDLGLPEPAAASVGGGSDGNFTAALGVPTLDGLGAVGDHAHAEGEYVLTATMPERAALVAALITDLLEHCP
ncbi:M20/M25/M40 family metallo-hydrolase [Pseudonocardia acidicola]|uniref:M20 family metallopeptidase n=1 Tax=Pseudonocardia acidicola TaxID=2724939 RepID=A0ABX1SD24_9PSEU|nr:M20/M25/M40 family metallo-hydrolase [Pseudonocardia acidicola]NMH98427.1 M20 family metallopeptidase [Pseudonocardia acidicola]